MKLRQGRFLLESLLWVLGLSLIIFVSEGCEPSSREETSSPQLPTISSSNGLRAANPSQQRGLDVSTERDRSPTESRTHKPKIVAFGNSLTAGLGVSPEEAYPAQLQRRLDEVGYQVRVINAGVSGETSAGGLRRVSWVLKTLPNLVILELGGNDGLRGLDPDQTHANLAQIIERFQSVGVPVVLVGMKMPPNYGPEFTAKFAALYPDLADRFQLPYMPFFLEGVATKDGLLQADGIHPTGDGYRIIVNNLLPVIEPILQDLARAASS